MFHHYANAPMRASHTPPTLNRALRLAALLVLALLLGACGRNTAPPQLEMAQLFPQARPLPSFQLRRSDGQPLTRADFRGRYTLVFMGYTHCPDICPTTLLTLRHMWDDLRRRGQNDKVAVVFVSVDPQRDTPQLLAAYVHGFDPAFQGATGSPTQLQTLSQALMLPFRIVPGKDGHYAVDHSATLAIVGPDAEEIGVFMPPLHATPMAADLARLIAWRSP